MIKGRKQKDVYWHRCSRCGKNFHTKARKGKICLGCNKSNNSCALD